MAESVALAVLENLVHLSRQDYPTGYVTVAATVPDQVLILDYKEFVDFSTPKHIQEQRAGDNWLLGSKSAVLRVPSAVVRGEWNYLINPQHADFTRIVVHTPVAMNFDERLFTP